MCLQGQNCKLLLPKNRVRIFDRFLGVIRSETVKSTDKNERKIKAFFKMSRFTSQNGPFWSAKRLILRGKMGHFEV